MPQQKQQPQHESDSLHNERDHNRAPSTDDCAVNDIAPFFGSASSVDIWQDALDIMSAGEERENRHQAVQVWLHRDQHL